jgi:hypothetical protein
MTIGIFIQILFFLIGKPDISNINFEGLVEYQIKYPNQTGTIAPEVPQKFIIFFKDGNIRKEYRNLKDSLLFYSIYLFKENTSFGFTPANDTILFYKPTSDIIDVKYSKGKQGNSKSHSSMILGYECNKYDIQISYKDELNVSPINYTYYVASQLSIDKKYLSGDGSNFIFTSTGGIILKYFTDNPVVKVVEAKSISIATLNNELFHVNTKGKFLKQI